MSVGPGALPGRLRLASLLSVLLSGLCGLVSAWQGFTVLRLSELKDAPPATFPGQLDPLLAEHVQKAQLLALEQMREPRMVVLFALALACSLSFVASTRLLRPAGLPREGVRRVLVWALVVAAALRTIDGAQASVLFRSAGEVVARGLVLPGDLHGASPEEVRDVLAPLPMVAGVLQTLVMVGPFLLLSQYFRSARVKAWTASADAQGLT